MSKQETKKQPTNPMISEDIYCPNCGCACNCKENGACTTPEGCPECGSKVEK